MSVMLGGHPVTAAYQPVVLNVITTLVMLQQESVTVPMATQVCVIASFDMWEIWWPDGYCAEVRFIESPGNFSGLQSKFSNLMIIELFYSHILM